MAMIRQYVYNLLKSKKSYSVRQLQTQPKQKTVIGFQSSDVVPVFRKASNYTDKIALRDNLGSYTYGNLFLSSKELSQIISQNLNGKVNERIVCLCPNDSRYVITQWASWMSGQMVVPLSHLQPQNMLEYYCNDSNAKLLITTPEYAEAMHRVAKNLNKPLFILDDKLRQNSMQKQPTRKSDMEGGLSFDFYNKNNALILYTSGTTGNPKGAVLSHKNIQNQAFTLIDSWKWTATDVILHVLPLAHIHGIINALVCPLYIGAKCIMLETFEERTTWSYLLGVNTSSPNDRRVTVFMGVPTIYSKLIKEYEKVFAKDDQMVEYIKNTLSNRIRLMVSGSAPLPVSTYKKWLDITGHKLLERYGMTETGMILSNSYDSDREPGFVGVPLPGVSTQVAKNREDDSRDYTVLLESSNVNGQVITKLNDNFNEDPIGELLVKGDNVFKEYFNNPQATKNTFTHDGWFKTGDIVQYNLEKKKFKILGRTSIDVIKSGGYKLSALDIESVLMEHPDIKECAVIGIEDKTWGESIAAIIVLKSESGMSLEQLKNFCADKLPKYSIPTILKIVAQIPKNAMGKINKREFIKDFTSTPENSS